MPRARIIQTNFTSGELSPRMGARVDLEQYHNGAGELTNLQVQTQGGVIRRQGSYYSGLIKNHDQRARMVPFIVSTLTAYTLEFGNQYLRFWRNHGQLVDSGGAPLELATPYLLADLRQLRFAQSADVMYICHPTYQPMKLSRIGANQFALAIVVFLNGPYAEENTGDPSAIATTPPTPATTAPGTAVVAPEVTGSYVVTTSPHRYWRIYINTLPIWPGGTDGGIGVQANLDSVAMAASPGGPDQIGSGTPSAASLADVTSDPGVVPAGSWTSDGEGRYPPDYLPTHDAVPTWWSYDFGLAVSLAEVRINAVPNAYGVRGPGDFDLQYSDDGTVWTTAKSFSAGTTWPQTFYP